ncbi:MAG: hypothetical protein QFB87_02685 [Patescibacteria group bacterium]|nr:hypothetical protein [Patescibacteria group bacterium]
MKRIYIRWLFIIVPALAPALIWWLAKPAAIQLQSTSEWIDAAAKLAGLIALSLLAVNIIISARLKLLDRIFFGLDNMYRTHHLTGGWVIIFLLIHSGLLTLKFSLISLASGYQFLLPSSDIPLTIAKMTLVAMTGLVVLTMYFTIRYEWFIIAMRLLGAAIFFGGFHAFFVGSSDLRAIKPLLAYMIILGSLAAGLYTYRSVFRRALHRPYDYLVDEVINHSAITEVWLKPIDGAMQRFAGQFCYVSFPGRSMAAEVHPFTISSGSSDRRVRFCMKHVGDYTTSLDTLTVGDPARLEGPYGNFSFTKAHRLHQVWISGGIGITPFLAMARSLDSSLHHHITLYYIIRNKNEAIFLNELEAISKQQPNFKVLPVFTYIQGRPKASDYLAGTNAKHTDFLVCGPAGMLKTVRQQLLAETVPRNCIFTEEFVLS